MLNDFVWWCNVKWFFVSNSFQKHHIFKLCLIKINISHNHSFEWLKEAKRGYIMGINKSVYHLWYKIKLKCTLILSKNKKDHWNVSHEVGLKLKQNHFIWFTSPSSSHSPSSSSPFIFIILVCTNILILVNKIICWLNEEHKL